MIISSVAINLRFLKHMIVKNINFDGIEATWAANKRWSCVSSYVGLRIAIIIVTWVPEEKAIVL